MEIKFKFINITQDTLKCLYSQSTIVIGHACILCDIAELTDPISTL